MSHQSQTAKRLLDVIASVVALVVTSPILLFSILFIWLQDRRSPFYLSRRIGRGGVVFRMVKLRSMIVGADQAGVDSTRAGDTRITGVGHLIRRFKLDELPQFWNVLKGDMSVVGPRPQVEREADLYTPLERRLLEVLPGITDFSSIVFADLAEILEDQPDPDIAYNQLVRPGKSRLSLFYVEHRSMWVDLQLLALTALAIVSRHHALSGVQRLLQRLGADGHLLKLARRREPLVPMPPPGSDQIVTARGVPPVRTITQ